MDAISASPTASTALGLLRSSSSGNAMFSAISGSGGTDSGSIFNAISPGSMSNSIDSLLKQKQVTTQKNALFADVANRLSYMQAGKYDASADWEKVASYAMQSGQPVAITLNSAGKVEAVPQSQADLSKYNTQQQTRMLKAMEDISTMAGKISGNKKNQEMIDKLTGAESDLMSVASGALTATSEWERQGQNLMTIHHPFKISLDSNGNLMVQDQATSSMDGLNYTQQKKLRAAVESIPTTIANNDATESWETDVWVYDQMGLPYYLEMDPVTSQITAKENSGENIVPDFLKTDPYPDIGDNTKLLKQAAEFIKKGKAYFLDFDTTGQIVAKEATAPNLIKYNTSTTTSQQTSSIGVGTILSVIA